MDFSQDVRPSNYQPFQQSLTSVNSWCLPQGRDVFTINYPAILSLQGKVLPFYELTVSNYDTSDINMKFFLFQGPHLVMPWLHLLCSVW